jgi:hypothetical protein
MDADFVAKIDEQARRHGWTRKELFQRVLTDALPRLASAQPALPVPESQAAK